MAEPDGLYILMLSVHGLIRGSDLELGRDADTGGQVTYVLELALALAAHEEVARVDLVTRQIIDSKVDSEYARPEERLADKAFLVRVPAGPRRYLRKEVLWPYLDGFSDQVLQHIRRLGRVPDIVHGHYADAGYVGAQVAALLAVPLIQTGHSLGRVKRQRLLDQGLKAATVDSQYNLPQRIEAEEIALDNAALVIASTSQEVEEQYSTYDNYQPRRMVVIPPGVDLSRFHPPQRKWHAPPIQGEVFRFLREPRKPMVLALSRPDPRKNLATLLDAYGTNVALQKAANLVVVAGSREDVTKMEKGPRDVLTRVILDVDRHDLYGRVAYPKKHGPGDVPDLYRLAAHLGGVFVNPALTEPFGLTLIEAAASGLPIVAPADGGPKDIVARCKNGVLIDPLDTDAMGAALLDAVGDRNRWKRWSRSGVRGAHEHFSWAAHVNRYLREVRKLLGRRRRVTLLRAAKSRLPTADRVLICDVDNTLAGDRDGSRELAEMLARTEGRLGFGVATGRNLDSARKVIRDLGIPSPDLWITAVGTAIHYGRQLTEDGGWTSRIDYRWEPEAIREVLSKVDGLKLQPKESQGRFKVSFFADSEKPPSIRAVVRRLRREGLHANVVASHGAYLDVVPTRASKGLALRYVAVKWGLPVEHLLVAGDSGNDEDMLTGNTLAVVAGNYSPELEKLRGRPLIYFAEGQHAWGVLEAIEHYDFLGSILVPSDVEA